MGIGAAIDSGAPVSKTGRYSGIDTTAYHDVVSWTVASQKVGGLREVSFYSDNLSKTLWRLSIAGVEQWTAKTFGAALAIPFHENNLPDGAIVVLQAKSSDGTAIVADGAIAGVEG